MIIHKPENQSLSLLDLEILHLEKGEEKKWCLHEFEVVVVLIQGSCSLSTKGETWVMRRRSVFEDLASAVFISPEVEFSINATEQTTLAFCKARANKKFKTTYISPEQVTSEWRGSKGYERKVFNIVHKETQTQRIAVGETISAPGEWSSFPPHKHDEKKKVDGRVIETALEEIYYFRLEPKTGFGFQRLYNADGSLDEAYVIKDGDVTFIPQGYHPVANIPGHQLYYLWMLAGEEREYIWNADPVFKFLEEKS